MQREVAYVQKQMGDSIVVTAPLYHQFTMNATLLPRDSFEMAYKVAAEDVLHQFDAYIIDYCLLIFSSLQNSESSWVRARRSGTRSISSHGTVKQNVLLDEEED